MRFLFAGLSIALLGSAAHADEGSDISRCRQILDSLQRLVCYDAIVVKSAVAPPVNSTPNKITVPISLSASKLSVRRKNVNEGIFTSRAELRVTYKNNSTKAISAIDHTLMIKNSFGDEIVRNRDKLDIRLKSGETRTAASLYFWEDNPFIHDQPYDALVGPIEAENAIVTDQVHRIVYTDGSVEDFDK